MTEQVCFDTLQFDEPWTLENYLKVGGYQAWKKILQQKTLPEDVIEEGRVSVVVDAIHLLKEEIHWVEDWIIMFRLMRLETVVSGI